MHKTRCMGTSPERHGMILGSYISTCQIIKLKRSQSKTLAHVRLGTTERQTYLGSVR